MISNIKDPSHEMAKLPEGRKLAILLLNLCGLLLPRQSRVGRRLRRGGEVMHDGGHIGGHGGGNDAISTGGMDSVIGSVHSRLR